MIIMAHRTIRSLVLLMALALFTTSCATVPITGRSQLSLLSSASMNSMSVNEYTSFKRSTPLAKNSRQRAMVQRVGTRLQRAVERYFIERGMGHELRGYAWEYNLFEKDEPNAWAMPGGKVAVYTGILPYTLSEAGLAVVMAHEIAHIVARHGNERMSQALLAQSGGMALDLALSKEPTKTRRLWGTVFGLTANLGILMPYSRVQESEADRLGLIFMAMAGYDPHEAVPFWQRMAAKGGSRMPAFLSTHPLPETRIRDIRAALPEAMRYYRKVY